HHAQFPTRRTCVNCAAPTMMIRIVRDCSGGGVRGMPRHVAKGHKQSFQLLARGSAVVARQGNYELSKHSGLSLYIDLTAMLFDNDVMGHREAEPCSFASRFGCEEGIEYSFSHLGRDAGTVVANPDFDCFAKIPCGSAENGLKGLVTEFDLAPRRSIEAVGNQI